MFNTVLGFGLFSLLIYFIGVAGLIYSAVLWALLAALSLVSVYPAVLPPQMRGHEKAGCRPIEGGKSAGATLQGRMGLHLSLLNRRLEFKTNPRWFNKAGKIHCFADLCPSACCLTVLSFLPVTNYDALNYLLSPLKYYIYRHRIYNISQSILFTTYTQLMNMPDMVVIALDRGTTRSLLHVLLGLLTCGMVYASSEAGSQQDGGPAGSPGPYHFGRLL